MSTLPPVIKRRKNGLVLRVFQAISEAGPMTRAEIAEHIGIHKHAFGSLLSRLICQAGPTSPQRLHIKDWAHEFEGARDYPRAVYALGAGRNKPKPRPKTQKTKTKSYYDTAKGLVTNVFDLGLPVKVRISATERRRSTLRTRERAVRPTSPGS